MRVDVETLGAFSDLAQQGAERAATSLEQLTGASTAVEVTQVELVPIDDLAVEFANTRVVGVEVGYTGGLDGTLVLVFDRESAHSLLSNMLPSSMQDDTTVIDESAVTEAANILAGGTLAAWGERFERKLKPEPPEYIDGQWEAVMPARLPVWNDFQSVLTFSSELHCREETIEFQLYMLPERESFQTAVSKTAGDDELPLSLAKLSAFNEMTKSGAGRAAEKVTTMSGIRTHVTVSRLRVAPVDRIEQLIGPQHRIGAAAALADDPGGFVLTLFDPDSARTIGDALLPMEIDEEGITDHHRSAIEELSNLMVSGFIDGWANALSRRIQHDPPELVEGPAADTIGPLLGSLDDEQQYAFLLDSVVSTPGRDVDCNLLAVPTERGFRTVVESMSLEDAEAAIYDPDGFEPAAYDALDE